MTENEFIEELKKLNIYINDTQIKQLEKYYELLIEWNKNINLTGIVEKDDVYLKHFYDSLTINKIIDMTKINMVCDVGTGAGFPGLVLKIIFPKIKIDLLDSLGKRIIFLNKVIEELKLENVNTILSRAEEYALSNREKYDLVVVRAVAPLNILNEYCIPLLKVNGCFVAMKGNVNDELNESKNSLLLLNAHIDDNINFKLPKEESNRTLIKILKDKKTAKIFPRKYSIIKKEPL